MNYQYILTRLSPICFLVFGVAAKVSAEESWMENYEWVLEKVEAGHYATTSEDAIATGKMTVEDNASKSASGYIKVTSSGYEYDFDGKPCDETYTFKWNLGGNYDRLRLIDILHVEIQAEMYSTLGDREDCPGSLDGTFVAMGTNGIVPPQFVEAEYWPPIGLATTGNIGPVYGWSNFYPHQAGGDLIFPEENKYPIEIEEDYPNYASIHMIATVSSNVAPGQIAYSVVYTYKKVKKSTPPNIIEKLGSLFVILNGYYLGRPSGVSD